MSLSNDFDWTKNKDLVVVADQAAIAVYENPTGAAVIRKERDWNEDDDIFIVIQRQNIQAVVNGLLALMNEKVETAAPPKPDVSAAALRQRRYRQRHSNGKAPQLPLDEAGKTFATGEL
jgi:hypothetical protein